jgi:hypothetical protein
MGKSTISTGPFSSSQTVKIYQAGYCGDGDLELKKTGGFFWRIFSIDSKGDFTQAVVPFLAGSIESLFGA